MKDIVRVSEVTKEFPSGGEVFKAIDDLSIEIGDEEFMIILGPSGSGKTTLLNLVSALISPTEGRVFIGDEEITALSDAEATRFRAQNIGLVFQFFNLFPALNALENVEIGVALKMDDHDRTRERARKYLDMVGLGGMEGKSPSTLSGGEQQRVAVARALAMEPKLLLADEPTGNLDAETSEEVWDLLMELNKRTGTTVVAVTHETYAGEKADRTVHLRSGRIEKIT